MTLTEKTAVTSRPLHMVVACPWTDAKNCAPLLDIQAFLRYGRMERVEYRSAYMLSETARLIEASEEYKRSQRAEGGVLKDLFYYTGVIFVCDPAQLPNAVRFFVQGSEDVGVLVVA